MKNVLILSSSGLDSTYLVYDNLKKGNRVTSIYVEVTNNSCKVEVEKKALVNQELFFKKNFPSLDYYLKLDNTSVSLRDVDYDLIFTQIPIWVFAVIFNTRNIDEVQIGYVMNDDAISYLQDIKDIYNQFSSISTRELPELTFPLAKLKKHDFISNLPEELLENVTFCEWPSVFDGIMKPCGDCPACRRYKNEGLYNKIIKESHQVYTISSKDFAVLSDEIKTENYGSINPPEQLQVITPYQYKLEFPSDNN